MQYPQCAFPRPDGTSSFDGVVTRPLERSARGQDAAATQTLVVCGAELQPMTGVASHGGLELGPPLQLFAEPLARREGQPVAPRRAVVPNRYGFFNPVWDPHSCAVYMFLGGAVLRLGSDDTVAVVAGVVEEPGNVDGPGGVARFSNCCHLASDGAGALYVGGGSRICKLQLPPAEATAALGGVLTLAAAGLDPAAAGVAGDAPPGGHGAAVDEVVVSTLLSRQLPPGADVRGLAFDTGSTGVGRGGSLLYATEHALYRLPLGATAADAAPVLLAGAEGVQGTVDGRGPDALFFQIMGLAVDGEGAVWVADISDSYTSTAVRRVGSDGTVTTVMEGMEGHCWHPAILPNGSFALCADSLHLLYLGLKPPPSCIAAAPPPPPTGPPPRTLPGDIGALFERQPDGTADMTIVAGGRTFHVHRLILSARSDYFRQLFGGSFAESGTQQLNLPDADPDAFALVLLFVYTGAVDIAPALAQAVAELADRLLLPELCQLAIAVVEAGVSAETVVGLLLWAEACVRGPAFSELLSRLKAWYVEHHEAVLEEAPDAVGRLAEQRPGLMVELTRAGVRASKRARTC
ncbi:ARM REPEAT PROTEIN INTERACTING WITH ABF2 [Tetrabaena socialis]|uniref:ARM REPEAT PROTEIN INTERACTING WITH ABF2 n=1 Tax=Tetrabaena socialis TaxID=47790 RepID=A0A2J7ZTM3_9CHLO|nr:ARM REPEAT PROTEIN INTERACTING WITH ABF2 [Tetrabaena socialis]|eukprot:PNH03619.1 ARM REPEAT PROTEIN INTERACTING WITH ABF2 [Tetrabaena socialis]